MSSASWNPNELTLVVDLDDTLIRTNSLFENFWAACTVQWRTPLLIAPALAGGALALKRRLGTIAPVAPARLPYNPQVLAVIEDWRARGGRVALVTGALQSIADAVAEHLGVFDEVHGSKDGTNLTGATKARFLDTRFGAGRYAYIGDGAVDMPVWQSAAHAITVNPSARFRAKVDALVDKTVHLHTLHARGRDYLRAMRPHQWLKNLLVFAPMLAAHDFSAQTALLSLMAFIAFSLVASSAYILNDLLDLQADRAHPRKRNRPFASGAIHIAHGTWMVPTTWLLGAGVALAGGWQLFLVVLVYYATTVFYSFHLKRLPIIDICVLAALYTLRIIGGGAATGIPLSIWLLAFSVFFFFSLAAIKRQAELMDHAASSAGGRGYRAEDLPLIQNFVVTSGLISVLVLAFYTNSEPVRHLYRTPEALWGICLILLFWTCRMAFLTHRGKMHDDPLVFTVRDRVSLCCGGLIALLGIAGALI